MAGRAKTRALLTWWRLRLRASRLAEQALFAGAIGFRWTIGIVLAAAGLLFLSVIGTDFHGLGWLEAFTRAPRLWLSQSCGDGVFARFGCSALLFLGFSLAWALLGSTALFLCVAARKGAKSAKEGAQGKTKELGEEMQAWAERSALDKTASRAEPKTSKIKRL